MPSYLKPCTECGSIPVLACNLYSPHGSYCIVACINEACDLMPTTSGGDLDICHTDIEAVEEWDNL